MEIVKDWHNDLIWCPSQMHLNVSYGGRHWVIYCRWRHSDPWSLDIVECPTDGKFDMHVLDNWNSLEFSKFFTQDSDIKDIHKDAIKQAKKWLSTHVKK